MRRPCSRCRATRASSPVRRCEEAAAGGSLPRTKRSDNSPTHQFTNLRLGLRVDDVPLLLSLRRLDRGLDLHLFSAVIELADFVGRDRHALNLAGAVDDQAG